VTGPRLTMADQLAKAIGEFQLNRTGYAPHSVTAILSENTIVVMLKGALTPAEKMLSRTPEGADKIRMFHRELFQSSLELLQPKIERITGYAVIEANAEVEASSSAVVEVSTTGTMVQVFQLAGKPSVDAWSGCADDLP
jgi:uncharacterized protein YbcI